MRDKKGQLHFEVGKYYRYLKTEPSGWINYDEEKHFVTDMMWRKCIDIGKTSGDPRVTVGHGWDYAQFEGGPDKLLLWYTAATDEAALWDEREAEADCPHCKKVVQPDLLGLCPECTWKL